jgi:uncharacterized protein (TIGR02145 family)
MKNFAVLLVAILVVVACKKEEETPETTPKVEIAKYGSGVYDYDSNFYKSVIITDAGEWTVENMRTSHFSNGDTIPSGIHTTDITGLGSPLFYFYPNGDSITNLKKYGRLYTYFVVEDGRNVCPNGWHVPTKAEYDTLTKYVGGQENGGGKLKATTLWAAPNTGADNESLFTGLPAGFREPQNVYSEVTKSGVWWTSTPDTANRVWTYYLKYGYSYVFRTPAEKNFAYSVRCKRD